MNGKIDKIKKELEEEMKICAMRQEYEEAGILRDKIQAIDNITQKQKVSNAVENNIDVIGIAKNEVRSMFRSIFCKRKQNDRKRALFLE
ncbi:MAG: hypothetical protein HFJ50_01765 [Clostridia bacterium]|nr:hypothetical protein [Clostridia bacterium]